jgi:hypothetical protein
MRLDSRVSRATRIEVVTDGVFDADAAGAIRRSRAPRSSSLMNFTSAVSAGGSWARIASWMRAQVFPRATSRFWLMSATLDVERLAALLHAPDN